MPLLPLVLTPHFPTRPFPHLAVSGPFTFVVDIATLVASASGLPSKRPTYALSLADYWNERREDWLYTEAGAFTERFGVGGYYVRIAPSGLQAGLCGRIDVRNRSGRSLLAIALIGMDYLYLPRLGLRGARDRKSVV